MLVYDLVALFYEWPRWLTASAAEVLEAAMRIEVAPKEPDPRLPEPRPDMKPPSPELRERVMAGARAIEEEHAVTRRALRRRNTILIIAGIVVVYVVVLVFRR